MSEFVNHYRVNLYSIEGKQEGKIVLHCANGHTLNLIFVDSDATLPRKFCYVSALSRSPAQRRPQPGVLYSHRHNTEFSRAKQPRGAGRRGVKELAV
jgi:hypothetical protein